MNKFLKKVYLKIYTKPLWFSLLLFILLIRVVPVIPLILYDIIYDFTDEQFSYDYADSLVGDIIFGGIIAPMIETLLFQTFLICLFHYVLELKYLTTVLLSGLLFGMLHALYSVPYALCASITGFILSFGYVIYTKKYSSAIAFLLIAGIHAFNNISSLIIYWLDIDL
jgi:hypothetical protein